uniref:Uncharacterized protein n=1 Tax=Vitis vinifera TaxID=29760 RepID=A5B2N3_VITVI|nr:hypothetical protein VITISV_025651 [Vitis vinifera]
MAPLVTCGIAHSTRGRILSGRHSTFFGCLTSGILLRRHSIWMSRIRNSSPADIPSECLTSGILLPPTFRHLPTFHLDVSHPKFFSADIPSGCITSGILPLGLCSTSSGYLTSEILLRQHSIRMSRIRNSSLPTFHPDVSHPEFFPPPTFHPSVSHPEFFSANIPSGCLASEILLPPTFHPGISHPEFFSADILRMSHIRNSVCHSSLMQDRLGFDGGPTYVIL